MGRPAVILEIVGKDRLPLHGVSVMVKWQDGLTSRRVTDENGQVELKHRPGTARSISVEGTVVNYTINLKPGRYTFQYLWENGHR